MVNLALLNEFKSHHIITSYRYPINEPFEAKSAIAIYIQAIDYLEHRFTELEALALHKNKVEVTIEMQEKVAKCRKIVQEFQIGFSLPNDHVCFTEMEKIYHRFTYMYDTLEIFFVTSNNDYLYKVKKHLLIIKELFQDVEQHLNLQDNQPIGISD